MGRGSNNRISPRARGKSGSRGTGRAERRSRRERRLGAQIAQSLHCSECPWFARLPIA
ncbi:hypothetical protein RGUI_1876 [Rhodovulum sp. P5]|nr:hypothetical protein RGUI_1876 [Rhodovulum sp. P5]